MIVDEKKVGEMRVDKIKVGEKKVGEIQVGEIHGSAKKKVGKILMNHFLLHTTNFRLRSSIFFYWVDV